MHDMFEHATETTLAYTAENGVVFYIVGFKTFCSDDGYLMLEVVHTRNKSVIERAMLDYEWAGDVPVDCYDEIVSSWSELRDVLEVRSHERSHIGYIVIDESNPGNKTI